VFLLIWPGLRRRVNKKRIKLRTGFKNLQITLLITFFFLVSSCKQAFWQSLIFLIVKGLSAKTPQPTPHLSAPFQQGDDILLGTTDRLLSLRGICLMRDRHRCVISRHFDADKADRRLNINGIDARDDDGLLLMNEELKNEELQFLEVAHIIPHALRASEDPSSQLVRFLSSDEAKILNLFVLEWC
jgi:hypothetical protein